MTIKVNIKYISYFIYYILQYKEIPFWLLPMYLAEESSSRIQLYDRLENWVGKRKHSMRVVVDNKLQKLVGYIIFRSSIIQILTIFFELFF